MFPHLPFDLHPLSLFTLLRGALLSRPWCNCCCVMRKGALLPLGRAYLVGVAGLEDVTGHLGLGVVGLAPQEIGKIAEVIAVVDEARDELRLVLKNKDRGVVAAGGDASDERGDEDQLNFSRLHHGAAVAPLAPPADLGHQPRQHWQGGPPVQRGPADVSQGESPVCLRRTALPLLPALHVDPRQQTFGRSALAAMRDYFKN